MSSVDITSTRPGTPGGRFMRQFWLAIHRSEDLAKGHARPIRIMSEDYTLYRGEAGRAQVLDYRCPHRGAPLHLGWVEGDALRCLYHGWKFDCSGQCVEMPAEDPNFPRKVAAKSYPTREYMGLVFAYFGEGEAPPFPPFPASRDASLIHVWNAEAVPCNWLQCYENSADEVHVAFVHQPGGSHAAIAELPHRGRGDRLGHAAPGQAPRRQAARQPALHAQRHARGGAAARGLRRRRRLVGDLFQLHAHRRRKPPLAHHQPGQGHRQRRPRRFSPRRPSTCAATPRRRR